MRYTICLDKEDVKVTRCGNAIWLTPTPELIISFSREALDEFWNDYKKILLEEATEACPTATTMTN